MRKSAAKNVLMKDGKVRRVEGDHADQLVDSGQAAFISNTVYRALKLGIEVKDPRTRDNDGSLRAQIKVAQEKLKKRHKKDAKRRDQEERELLDEDEDERRSA